MGFKNTLTTYGSVTKVFHWLIFLLVLFNIIYGFSMEDAPKAYIGTVINIHKLTGLTILSLVFLRALWALVNPRPPLPIGTPYWQRALERIVHYLLYLVLFAMPLAGWIGSVAAGRAPHIGDFYFQLPVPHNKALGTIAMETHNTIAIVIIVIVSLHILAALYHHFIKKDDILLRMLPNYRPVDPITTK